MAAVALQEGLVLIGMSIGLMVSFRSRFAAPAPLRRLLSANAYTVYIIHPPVVIALTYACRDLPHPSLLKFVLLAPLCVTASFTISQLIVRRIPGASRVL